MGYGSASRRGMRRIAFGRYGGAGDQRGGGFRREVQNGAGAEVKAGASPIVLEGLSAGPRTGAAVNRPV